MNPPRSSFFKLYARYRWIVPAIPLALITVSALFAPLIVTHDPWDLKTLELKDSKLAPPWTERGRAERTIDGRLDTRYFLGTDEQGRDILAAVLFGLRVSIFVGLSATCIALVVGSILGLVSGYFGGRLDAFIMRVADIQLSFPSILIALFLMAVWGPGLRKIVLAVAIVHWVVYARIARGMVLVEREKDYISAVRASGAGTLRIMIRHLLPNILGPILVISSVKFSSVVILEATLSFLGLGVPVTRPTLGMLVSFGQNHLFSGEWWIWFFPGMALVILVFCVNWLADILRADFGVKA